MSAAVSYERVRDQLDRLKMKAALTALDGVLEGAQKTEKLAVEVLDELPKSSALKVLRRELRDREVAASADRPRTS